MLYNGCLIAGLIEAMVFRRAAWVKRIMTDLEPCLAGCDSALAEADLLLAILAASGTNESALAPVRDSIATLHREVDRLRGFKVAPLRKKADPFWMELGGGESPWSSTGASPGD